ncbi:metalloprotease [Fusarium solani]|nr:metalloprotease [Fusarium solani]
MKLVVLGRESLDVLQKWVVELFSPVVNKKLPLNRWPDELPFRESDLGMQCFAKPVKDLLELNLNFPFMDEESMFASQSSRYIGYLIGHKAPGGIMWYTESKGWVKDVRVTVNPICPGTPGIFNVCFYLKEEGLQQYTEIIKTFFQYVGLLHESPPQEWIFKELKYMADTEFKYMEETSPSSFASTISSVMKTPLSRKWLLSGYSCLQTFEPKQIEEALATFRPDNLRITIVSRNYPGNWNQKEKWYGTDYRSEKIPEDLMREIRQAASVSPSERLPCLHLPDKNPFIPDHLEVKKMEATEAMLNPRVLRNDGIARTWWKKDDTFRVPRANIIVSLKTPLVDSCAEDVVKAHIYTDLVRQALEKYSYYAEFAGLQYSIDADPRGLCLNVRGYNSKLLMFLEKIVMAMPHLNIMEGQFKDARQCLTRAYKNWSDQSP